MTDTVNVTITISKCTRCPHVEETRQGPFGDFSFLHCKKSGERIGRSDLNGSPKIPAWCPLRPEQAPQAATVSKRATVGQVDNSRLPTGCMPNSGAPGCGQPISAAGGGYGLDEYSC